MNFRPDIIKPSGPGALADEPDFPLGTLVVLPSRLEIGFDGKREAVQPRVMQVLVALARANGAVVSRDELIRQCWGGQIVGDDAINRSVAKVRALADLAGEPAFDIETVPRVGYRLKQNFPAPERVGNTPRTGKWPNCAAAYCHRYENPSSFEKTLDCGRCGAFGYSTCVDGMVALARAAKAVDGPSL